MLALAVFVIIIACIGLFGLSVYMAEQRTKEIGIRKALGSTSSQIVKRQQIIDSNGSLCVL